MVYVPEVSSLASMGEILRFHSVGRVFILYYVYFFFVLGLSDFATYLEVDQSMKSEGLESILAKFIVITRAWVASKSVSVHLDLALT